VEDMAPGNPVLDVPVREGHIRCWDSTNFVVATILCVCLVDWYMGWGAVDSQRRTPTSSHVWSIEGSEAPAQDGSGRISTRTKFLES
jgi:hypothetical protein